MSKFGEFLQILCMCHGIDDRCFHIKGRKFPICARCTGTLIGTVLGVIIYIFGARASVVDHIICMCPMILDGYLQYCKGYMSNNTRRFATGFLFGIGYSFLFCLPMIVFSILMK